MPRAACHLEAPEGGGLLGRKRSARCTLGLGLARRKGGEERSEGAGQRSRGEGGGPAAAPGCLGVDFEVRAGSWAASLAALESEKSRTLLQAHTATSIFLQFLVCLGISTRCPRWSASAFGRLWGERTWEECMRNSASRL